MRLAALLAGSAAILTLAACATSGEAPAGPPSLIAAPGAPAPPRARLYADCLAQAAGAGTFDREENLIRFRCTGAPARAFYAGLGAWSAARGSQYDLADGRTVRFTQAVQQNPTGLDSCSTDNAGDFACTLVFNAGEFLTGS